MHALIVCRLRPAAKHRLPRRKFQNCGRQAVGPKIRVSLERAGHPQRLLLKNKSRHRDRVAPNIEQPAAPPFRLMSHILGIAIEIAEDARRRPQFPDPSAANDLPRAQPLRVRFYHERFAYLHTRAIARRQQCLRLRHVQAEWLLAQHMLPRLRCFDGPRHVQMIRQRVVNRLNLAVLKQLLVRSVGLRNSQLPRRFFRLLLVARSNRGNFAARALLHPWNHFAHGNRRRSQDSPLHLLHSLLRCFFSASCSSLCALCDKAFGPLSLHYIH